jgi:hypothetical protein
VIAENGSNPVVSTLVKMAAEKHISVPKSFSGGDVTEWLQWFEICCESNAWTEAIKLRKLPTLLKGRR